MWPFGRQVVSNTSSTGCLNMLCNIIWLLCGGLYTALVHICFGILLFITIIGIPFARQHFKLAEISLMPFGKTIIYGKELANRDHYSFLRDCQSSYLTNICKELFFSLRCIPPGKVNSKYGCNPNEYRAPAENRFH